jgi:hypothetical protein
MYAFEETATINGDLLTIWQTVSDVATWATWDPHILNSGFDEPFEVGSRGWTLSRVVAKRRGYFTLVEVEPEKSYTTRSPMPLGRMMIINRYVQQVPGKVDVSRRVEVYGAFTPLFRWKWADAFQSDTRATFKALEKEAHHRMAQAGSGR